MNLEEKTLELVFDNLTDYGDPNIESLEINGVDFRGKPDYEPEATVVPAFGNGTEEDSYNQILADTIKEVEAHYGELPIVGQYEIMQCLGL